jgi:hypothetical protein
MRLPAVVCVVGLLACGAGLAARQGAAPTGVIQGRVIDESTSQPVSGALVTLTGLNPPRRVIVGSDGVFEFATLPAGAFTLRADRPGYLPETTGQRSPTGLGRALALADGGQTEVVLAMWKTGAITGTVIAANDQPLAGVEVHALERTLVGGLWQWTDAAQAMSDDHGRYHLTNLTPGDFLVVARAIEDPETPLLMALLTSNAPSAADVMADVASSLSETPDLDSRVPASTTTYFATPPNTRPSPIRLGPGASRPNVDLHLRSAHGVRVRGSVSGLTGPLAGLTLRLVATIAAPADRSDRADQDLEVAAAACDTTGRFAFSHVAPGHYSVVLNWMPPLPPALPADPRRGGPGAPPQLPLPTQPAWWARAPVDVATTDIAGVTVTAHSGITITGAVAAVTGSPAAPTGLDTMTARLEPVGMEVLPAVAMPGSRMRIEPSGQITSSSVPPGRYLLRLTPPRGWTVVSATRAGHDWLDEPLAVETSVNDLVVTLSDHPLGTLTGTVTDGGEPARDATVVIFPAHSAGPIDTTVASRRLRAMRIQPTGAFSVGNLPAGDYFAVALAADLPAGWQDPGVLTKFEARAAHLTVTAGPMPPLTLEVVK